MKRLWICVLVLCVIVGSMLLALRIYDSSREQELRKNISKIKAGMNAQEVIQILGEPTERDLSDIPGTYWCYDTSTLGRLFDDNPSRIGQMVLEMSSDGKVVKVFDLK